MKKIGTYVVIGLVVAFVGVLLADGFADIFNGLSYSTGVVLGMCAYLCVVIVVCTGVLAAKLERRPEPHDADSEEA